jgi:hypothetical protein
LYKVDDEPTVNACKVDVYDRVKVMVHNAIFNNISVILWRSILWVEEDRVPGENHKH